MKLFFTLLFFLFTPILSHSQSRLGIVTVPVCDLRSSTQTPLPINHNYDPNQESQLLYGEPVKIISEWNGWFQIEALEQHEFSHNNRWQGYPGWVKKENIMTTKNLPIRDFIVQKKSAKLYTQPTFKSATLPISLGTKLSGTDIVKNGFRKLKMVMEKTAWIKEEDILSLLIEDSEENRRDRIITAAKELLGDPYFWGGRSAHLPELEKQVTGVDCSGLVTLAYSVAGLSIPRDAQEQFLKCTQIKKEELKIGDLIFSASKNHPEKVSHVSIYLDSETILEAPQTGEKVRMIDFEKKYGLGDRILYFGSYIQAK